MLKRVDTPGSFSAIFPRETTFVTVYIPAYLVPSEKGSMLKGKNLLPKGANSFFLG